MNKTPSKLERQKALTQLGDLEAFEKWLNEYHTQRDLAKLNPNPHSTPPSLTAKAADRKRWFKQELTFAGGSLTSVAEKLVVSVDDLLSWVMTGHVTDDLAESWQNLAKAEGRKGCAAR